MKTKNIFKTLAFAILMPAMLLTTACGKETVNDENTHGKGFALPVTVNVSREGDDATKATYTDNGNGTGSLAFSTGDQLFVAGDHADAGRFAGVLDYDAVSGKFSGTVTTQNEYPGTAEELLSSAADDAEALLIPAGYKSYEYFELVDESTPNAGYYCEKTNAFALTKAAAVEQFSFELAETYSSGFTLSPQNAIVSFTISGLTANKEVEVSFDTYMCGVISKSVTTSAEGVATFAIGLDADIPLENCTLTVDGNAIAMPTKTVVAGKIYNMSRSVAPAGPTAYTLAESTVGMIVGSDGKAYAVEDKDNLPTGVTAVAMVAYKSGSNGLAIQLNESPEKMNWADAKTNAEGLTAVSGGTWRLPSKDDWQNMFVGCAVSGDATVPDANNEMDPIAGFKAKIAATGITWKSSNYWSSTESSSPLAWFVRVKLDDGDAVAAFSGSPTFLTMAVLGCLAF